MKQNYPYIINIIVIDTHTYTNTLLLFSDNNHNCIWKERIALDLKKYVNSCKKRKCTKTHSIEFLKKIYSKRMDTIKCLIEFFVLQILIVMPWKGITCYQISHSHPKWNFSFCFLCVFFKREQYNQLLFLI